MLMKKPAHRVFDYTPRFYDPDKDPDERRRKRLAFSKMRRHTQKKRSPIVWLIFILVIIFLIIKFSARG